MTRPTKGDMMPDYEVMSHKDAQRAHNDLAVRQLAQSDPFPNNVNKWGQAVTEANRKVESLITTLRELDHLSALLTEGGAEVDVDLGPIGNAAASVRRDLEKQQPTKFEMPR